MKYIDALTEAMKRIGTDDRAIFIGQAVRYTGTKLFKTFSGVDELKKVEMPVAEDMQMGISIGLAMNGFIPITVYPRWNFLLLATNQLVNHLDKIPQFSEYRPGVIVRVAAPDPKSVVDPGPQHTGDFTAMFGEMLDRVKVAYVEDPVFQYLAAWCDAQKGKSTVLVERTELYETEIA